MEGIEQVPGVVEIDATQGADVVARQLFELGMTGQPYRMKGDVPDPPSEKPKQQAKAGGAAPSASERGRTAVEAEAGASAEADLAEEPEQEAEEEAEDDVHPLLGLAQGRKPKGADLEVPESVATWFKENKLGDVGKILKEYPTLRAAMTKQGDEITALKRDQEFLGKLSPEARNVVDMDLAGKDWKKEVVSRPSLDYRLTFDKQNKQRLAEAYAPGEVTAEQREEAEMEDADPVVKRLVDAVDKRVRMLYERDRDDVMNYQQRTRAELEAHSKAYEASRGKSLQYVFDYVTGSEAYKDEIEKAVDDLNSLFFEKDGTLRHDAALNAWFVQNRDRFLQAKETAMRQEAKDEAKRDLLRRSKDRKPLPKSTGNGMEKTAEQTAKELFNRGWLGI